LLVAADKNPNTNGARLNGICFTEIGIKLPDIAPGHTRREDQDAASCSAKMRRKQGISC
jgi:hypothetical protein